MASLSDIKYVLFGVQFNHSFKLLDDWGKIADDILKSEYFGSDFFTNISMQYTTERELRNPNTGSALRLTANNLVFKYYIDLDSTFEKEYELFCNRINKYLVEKILSTNKLIVRRVGVVFACELEKEDIVKFAGQYFKDNIVGITDFRFAQKEPTSAGQLWRGTDDYINKIFTVGRIEDLEAFQGVTYDFQLYYKPIQADIRNKCSGFLKYGLEGFKKDILNQK